MTFNEIWRLAGPPPLSVQEAEVTRNGRTWLQRRVVVGDDTPGVVIVPVRGDQLGLIRIWRPTVDEQRLELPRGFGESDAPEQDARRELAEETALVATTMRKLGVFNLDTGLMPTPIVAFEAIIDDAEPGPWRDGEIDDLVWVPLHDLPALIRDGAICDAISLAALAYRITAV